MVTIPLNNTANRKMARIDVATLLKKATWLFIVSLSIIYSIVGSLDDSVSHPAGFERWVYVYLNFLSFVLGVLAAAVIFFRRPSNVMALVTSLMLVTFTATDHGLRFWYLVFTGVTFTELIENIDQLRPIWFNLALFIDVLYMGLLTGSLTYVLLSFPEGRLISRRTRWFFSMLVAFQFLVILLVAGMCLLDILADMGGSLSISIYLLLDNAKAILLLILAAWPLFRLRRLTDPVQRQQIKWIGTTLTAMTVLYAVHSFVPADAHVLNLWTFFLGLILTYAFIVTLFIAIMRYRLWDMNFMMNKALVYSSMTAVLGMIGFAGATVLSALAENFMQSDSSVIGVAVLLIVAAVFNPVKDWVQDLVDRHLKPDEVDFTSAMVEIAPDAQLMLTSGEILKILVHQCADQLNLAGASVYLKWPDGQLVQSEPVARNPLSAHLQLDDKARAQLEKGQVVLPPEGSHASLYIPLVLSRASRPDFLGVLVLGKRTSGEGYPTVLLKSLRKLGCDAGRALYLAQFRERIGNNPVERLAAIGKDLTYNGSRSLPEAG